MRREITGSGKLKGQLFLGASASLLKFASWLAITCFGLVFCIQVFAQPKETIRVAGLKQPVEVIRDKWGIPHIFARNEKDLFFAQGFVVASDRLWQLELWRRKATGTLSAIFGRRFLQADIGSRLLRFRGDLEAELSFYHPRSKEIIASFVQGINAFLHYGRQKPELLPVEFSWLGFQPEPWTPEVVISRHNGLFRNATEEIAIARAIHLLGPEKVSELLPLKPKKPDLTKEVHLDFSRLTDDILALYRAARAEITFQAEDIVDPEVKMELPGKRSLYPLFMFLFPPQNALSFALQASFLRDEIPVFGQERGGEAIPGTLNRTRSLTEDFERSAAGPVEGSNNWVVSGSRTASGKPLLANDPHRALELPSLRTWVHLVAPGWNVIGGGEPALPGVAIGHNEHGAFGLTIFAVDQEDLYIYETNPENPEEYRYGSSWEKMKIIREKIEVKAEAPVEVELRFTRHGPVLYEDRQKHIAVGLRAAWLEVGGAPYLASLRLDQAANWQEFQEACRFFHTPSENLIWADVSGNIGWQAVGLTPRRQNFSGLVPVPGDGRFEWDGFIPVLELPHLFNPPAGFIATANECNLPADFPYPVGFLWAEPFRSQRIKEVLEATKKVGLQDMISLQQDVVSIPARKLVGLLKGLEINEESLKPVVNRLLAWNGELQPNSIEAAIYVTWQQNLLNRVWGWLLPEDALRIFPRRSLEITIELLISPPADIFGPEPAKKRNAILLASLGEAVRQLRERLGPDGQKWFYGQERFHHALLRHPLSSVLKPDWRQRLDIGPLPRGGDANTVCATAGTYRQTSGATFRLIADLNNWDNSLGTNCPGQSGDFRNPHYADLFRDWAEGRYFPALFSREKILAAAEKIILLLPTEKTGS